MLYILSNGMTSFNCFFVFVIFKCKIPFVKLGSYNVYNWWYECITDWTWHLQVWNAKWMLQPCHMHQGSYDVPTRLYAWMLWLCHTMTYLQIVCRACSILSIGWVYVQVYVCNLCMLIIIHPEHFYYVHNSECLIIYCLYTRYIFSYD